MGQFGQNVNGGTNDTDKERSIDTLYLGRADNKSGHSVFKLDTKAVVSANRLVVIPTTKTDIDRIDEMGTLEKQPEGVQFRNKDGKVTINDLDLNLNDDDNNDSNASDESFFHDKEYQEEFNKEEKMRFEDLATDEVQDDHFQLPLQQHQALLTFNKSKVRSAKLRSVKGTEQKTNKRKWSKTR